MTRNTSSEPPSNPALPDGAPDAPALGPAPVLPSDTLPAPVSADPAHIGGHVAGHIEKPEDPRFQTAAPSPLSPFRFPAFRAIWIANLASSLGGMIQTVAAAWLMTDLTRSHQYLSMVQASGTIPILLLGVIAGAIADNYDRRRVMLAAQTGMLLVSAGLAIATWMGVIGPLSLLAFTFAIGCGVALNAPAWQASVRLQVGHEHMPQAISLNAIAANLARSAGPALGGVLISLAGPSFAFALNAVSYVALIIVLLRWKPESKAPVPRPIFAAIKVGLVFCAQSQPLRRVLVRGLCFGVGAAGYQALLPAFVRERLQGTEIAYGLCLGAFGIGSIVTALYVGKLRRRFGTEGLLQRAFFTFALMLLLTPLMREIYLVMLCVFVAGGCWVAALTTMNVAMQMRSPEAILGRCLSIYQAVTFGGMTLGAYGQGFLSDLGGLSFAFACGAGWLVLTSVVLHFLAPMPLPGEGRVLPR